MSVLPAGATWPADELYFFLFVSQALMNLKLLLCDLQSCGVSLLL
jgi:hypothetical protein